MQQFLSRVLHLSTFQIVIDTEYRQRVSESVYKKYYVWRKQKLGDSSSDQVSGVAACKQRKNGTIMPWNMTCIYNSEQPLLKLELLLIG